MIKYKKYVLCLLFLTILFIPYGFADEWKEFGRGRHFKIYYDKAPEDFVKKVSKYSEESFNEIMRNLGFAKYKEWKWDKDIKVYVYNDMDSYREEASHIKWSHGSALVREKVILTFPSAHGFFDSTLPHELGHIIFREFIGQDTVVPLWLEEGVAMYQETARRFGADEIIKKAISEGKFIPLTELSNMGLHNNTDQERLSLFYSEAASIISFIINELGEFRFMRFCRELGQGTTFEEALKLVYTRFNNVEQLNKAWVEYINK